MVRVNVARRADEGGGSGGEDGGGEAHLGGAEVAELGGVVGAEEDVGGGDVAVDDLELAALMEMVDCSS